MDSLTQIVLGAAVGEAVLGKKVGNKALLWGAIAGTIPDLDVIFRLTHSYLDSLELHRGFSHSITFSVLFAPLLGWLLWKLYRKKEEAGWKDWTKLAFFGLVTHPILDNFTTWGTQFFWPFSEYRIAWKTIFVIDPLYTVPFLAALIWLMFKKRGSRGRRRLNLIGIGWSTFYLLVGVINHQMARSVFEEQLQSQNIESSNLMVRPTPMNTILWGVTAPAENGYYLGYHSLLDDEGYEIPYVFVEHQHHLLTPYLEDEDLQRLLKITDGYYLVTEVEDGFVIHDMRFGQSSALEDPDAEFVFRYHMMVQEDGTLVFDQYGEHLQRPMGETFSELWTRMKGLSASPPDSP